MPKTGGTFTGTVNGVTPTSGDNSTKLATTAYVQGALSGISLSGYMPKSGGTFTGNVSGVTPTAGDNSTKFATTAYVQGELGSYTVFDADGKLVFPDGTKVWIELPT